MFPELSSFTNLEMVEDVPARQRVAVVLRDEDDELVLPDGEETRAAVVPHPLVGRLVCKASKC